jgi:thymidylate synthase (FAD)
MMEVLGNGYINLVDSMGDDLRIVNAARKSFGKDSKDFSNRDRKLLKYLWDNKHTSPFEMVEFTFEVKAPLFVVRQWQRHRTWSYNEVSRRYTSENLDFHIPIKIRKQAEDNKQSSTNEEVGICPYTNMSFAAQLQDHVCKSLDLYNEWIDRGLCREQARMILPQNMMVEFVAKVDLKNLIDFLYLRLHPHAQLEIQEYAKAIVELIEPVVPETMKLFREGENNA